MSQQAAQQIKAILDSNNNPEKRHLFAFSKDDPAVKVLWKFKLWARYFFPQYFTSKDAPFHDEIDASNLRVYRGELTSFVNIAFRGAAKTARTKLFRAFVICNDTEHSRKYLRILSEDGENSRQIVTDIYNMLISPRVYNLYPEIFAKTTAKREERMSSFTTATGVKVLSSTVGMDQRGALQEDARPDEIWFEDFENRKTLRSGRITKNIAENMEEARTGLAKGGGMVYTCNYISEQGNVHKLVTVPSANKKVLIVPIIDSAGLSAWERYSLADIEQMRQDDEDFEGERLCKPSASRDIFFDREMVEKQETRQPIRNIAGFRIFKEYNASHRYAGGHDVAGGVGLDSSTSVFIDFDVIPAQVVAVFDNNLIKPDTFGDEIAKEADYFGGCLVAPEKNNHGHATIARLRQLEANIYFTQAKDTKLEQIITQSSKEYGWHTNALTKPKMLFALAQALEKGMIDLNDEKLKEECKGFTRNDLIENEKDPRLTTRHFDLVIALAIAWQMKDHATVKEDEIDINDILGEDKPRFPQIGI